MPHRRIVQLEVPEADAELAADALWQAGPSAVSEQHIGDGRVRLTADVGDAALVDARWPVVVLELDTEEHLDAWRRWAVPVRAGRRVVLHPTWSTEEPAGEDVVVRLDPGRSFGSGSHPSTRLVVAALEARLAGGEEILDVGCGSGVLAITALLLGARTAVGIDLDPAAVEVSQANAEINGVADRLVVSTAPLAEVSGVFDVVVANIGAGVLRAVGPDLVQRLRPGGWLVLAGLLREQADDVVAGGAGCEEVERLAEDGWVALVLRRS